MESLIDVLNDMGCEDALIFNNPSYYTAVVGVSDDNRVIYDYDLMLEYLVDNEDMTYEDAADYVSYDTMRSLSYCGENSPIIMFKILE